MTEYNIRLNPNCAAAVHTGLKFKAGDKGITFRIAVDELDTTGTTAKIVFLRANGTSVESDISGTDGVYIYKTLGNEFAVPGKTVADVKFYASGNRESTASFVFEVCGDTMNGLGAGTGGYSDRLEQLVSEAEAAGELTEQAKVELEAAESNMKTTEAEMAAVLQNFKEQYGEVGALIPRGNWNSSVRYGIRDVVFYMGYSWICLVPNTGNAPVDGSDYWMKNADLDYSNPNLLIDPNFELQLEGTKKWSFGQGSGTVEKADSGITVTLTTEEIQFVQHTEKMYFAEDCVLTGSIEFGEYTGSSVPNLVLYVDNTWKTNVPFSQSADNIVTLKASVLKGTHSVGLGFFCNGIGSTTNIKWAKLELGSVATPFIPPNKEVEKLKCLGVSNFREKTKTIITTFPTPTEECDYMVTGGDITFPYPFGNLSIRKGSYSTPQEWIATFKTTGDDARIYYNMYHNIYGWKGWRDISDGGNADTVDGFHASDFANSVDFMSASDFSYMQNRSAIGYHYRLQLQNGAVFLWESADSGATWTQKACWDKNYLPLDGSVPMSGQQIGLYGGYGAVGASDRNAHLVSRIGNTSASARRALYVRNQNESAHMNDALTFSEIDADGTVTSKTVLHTGNSQKVVTSASAPSDTSALWYDTTNKILKRYVDGAWQA